MIRLLPLTLLAALLPAQAPQPSLRLYGEMYGTRTFLVDENDVVVQTWNSLRQPGLGVYLAPDGTLLRTVNTGAPAGTAGGAGGGLQRQALDGSLLWDFRYDQNGNWSHHDIEPLPNGNVLMIAWETKTPAEAIAAGRNPAWAGAEFRPDHIIEVQQTGPTTGAIVWEWHAWDHLIQDFDPNQANVGVVRDHPELLDVNYPPAGVPGDWTHCNGIDYDAVHDWIVVTSRHMSEFWVIDHSTTTAEAAGHTGGNYGMGGDILYRWGNPAAYQRGTAVNQTLFGPHGPQVIPQGYPGAGNVLLYNNAAPGGSSADEIVLPLDAANRFILPPGQPFGPAAPVWSFGQGVSSPIVSSAVRAPNGNTMICNGQVGHLLEVDPAGQTVWTHSRFGSIFHAHYVETDLWADRQTLALTPGGTVGLDLIAGSSHALDAYIVLGSAAGSSPGFTLRGIPVPLNPDGYFGLMASQPNSGPFGSTFGVLDSSGRATASVTLPPGLVALAGLRLHHAFIAFDRTTLQGKRVSNAVPLDLVR